MAERARELREFLWPSDPRKFAETFFHGWIDFVGRLQPDMQVEQFVGALTRDLIERDKELQREARLAEAEWWSRNFAEVLESVGNCFPAQYASFTPPLAAERLAALRPAASTSSVNLWEHAFGACRDSRDADLCADCEKIAATQTKERKDAG